MMVVCMITSVLSSRLGLLSAWRRRVCMILSVEVVVWVGVAELHVSSLYVHMQDG